MSFRFTRRLAVAALFFLASFSAAAQISINEILADNKDLLNPDGSISDWVELYNDGTQAVSLAGYSLTDSTATPRKWIIPSGVNIPAKGFLLVLLDSSRPASIAGGFPLNAGFSIKASGDRLELYNSASQLVESVRFGPQAADYSIGRVPAAFRSFVLCTPTPGSANIAQTLGPQADLRINEWMPSPSTGKDWFEIYNPGAAPVLLTGLYFTDDGNTPSPIAPFSYIGTGRYGYLRFFADNSTNDNEVTFKLSGSGDSISLFTSTGTRLDSVSFGQQIADISEGRLPDGSTTRKSLTTPTPGESNLIPYPGLVVNELLSHTDPPLEDAVEFYNQTANPINIGGWYLSNSRNELKKYRIPSGTSVQPKGYVVFYEYQFNPGGTGFTFNSARGDQVYLSQANAADELTGYIVSEEFEPSENGVSFGRYETSVPGDYKFVAMERRSFGGPDLPQSLEQFRSGAGASNSLPKVGPLVINEIMYNPPAVAADGSDNIADEFVEILNITGSSVLLFDPLHPDNHWKLKGGVTFLFPSGSSIPAFGNALVVSFDPVDTASLSAFRSKYAVPATTQIFGPYSGKLGNGGDAVELYKPDPPQLPPHPDAGLVPYIRVDKVNFTDVAPWPTDADGTGKSLQRKNSSLFGNDPVNWIAAAPTAGKSGSSEVTDSDGDGMTDIWERQYGLNPNNASDAAADPDGDGLSNLQEFIAGTYPKDNQSRLAVRVTSVDSVRSIVSFSAVPGKSYSVQYRNNLLPSTTWQKLASTNAIATDTTVIDTGSPGRSQRFYRVVTPAVD